MKTKSAILENIDQPLKIVELEIPSLAPGQVLVQVNYSGICQSQINEWRGKKGNDPYLPHTLGHEGTGKVLEISEGVTRVKPGDTVVMTWIKTDGCNVPGCTYKDNSGRVVNSGVISTFMEKTVISENRLVPVNEKDIPLDIAALLGCAILTGSGMVLNELIPEAGSSIAIWGIGGIGACAVMASASSGCNPVIAIDIKENKLKLAGELGATDLINGNDSPVDKILELTNGKGVDYGIESAGNVKVMEAGFSALKKSGGKFILAGNVSQGSKMQIDPFDLIAGKKISGSWGGAANPAEDIPKYIQWYKDGKLPLEKLITHRFPLDKINDAFSLLESGDAGRILIDIN